MNRPLLEKSIRDIEPGDFLAEDVTDERGRVILSKGTELGAEHAEQLLKHRIFTVKVGTQSQVVEMELVRGGGASELEHMFEPHMDDPLMKKLYEAARGHLGKGEA